MSTKKLLITIYVIIVASLSYFFTYGISSALFAGDFATTSVFGNTKDAITIAQIIGFVIGKIIGATMLHNIKKSHRFILFMIVTSMSAIPLVIFGFLPAVGQVCMMLISGMFLVLIWGFLVFYIEGRYATDIIIMVIYMALIMASGISKTLATVLMRNEGISENFMPAICATIGCTGTILFMYLLSIAPPPTEEEKASRQAREPSTSAEQTAFFKKYRVGLTAILIVYGMLSAYRNFRDYYALELWTDLLGADFDSGTYSLSEIIVSIAVTAIYCGLIFIKNEVTAFFVILGMMLSGGIVICISTIFGEYNGFLWIVMVGIGAFIAYVPPGAMLYDKLMAASKTNFTTVFLIYVSEVAGSSTTLLVILLKTFAFSTTSFITYFTVLSYLTSAILIVGMSVAIICFARTIRNTPVEHIPDRV
jgi:hypothetical protein